MSLVFRPYAPQDRDAVLAVFRSNVPRYFAAAEERDVEAVLAGALGPHWVGLEDGRVVAYGGFEIGDVYSRVTLVLGMVAADRHGRGLGRRLLVHRAREALRMAPPETVHLVVDTTPEVAGFYRRMGFEEVSSWPRGYRSGFDMVVLRVAFGSRAMAALVADAPAAGRR